VKSNDTRLSERFSISTLRTITGTIISSFSIVLFSSQLSGFDPRADALDKSA